MTSAGITNLINYLAEVEPLRKQWRETKTAKTVTTPFIKLEKELKQLYKTKK